MSRTKQAGDKAVNPARMFLRWDSEACDWQGWDKDKEARFHVPAKTPFIVLDMLSTVTGFDDRKGAGIWSNEVRDTRRESFRVGVGKDIAFTGSWSAVKAEVAGAKFATSVYALAKVDGEYQLVNFKVSGCALGPWIDFVKEVGGNAALYEDKIITVGGTEEGKKGSVTFNRPVFKVVEKEMTDEARQKADDADRVLQKYLDGYFKKEQGEAIPEGDSPADEVPEPEHDGDGVEIAEDLDQF